VSWLAHGPETHHCGWTPPPLWLHRPSREVAAAAFRLIPDLARLVRGLLADGETPTSVRVALAGLLLYLLSPIDLIPDFVPVIGAADDLIIAAVVLHWVGRRVGLDQLRAGGRETPTGSRRSADFSVCDLSSQPKAVTGRSTPGGRREFDGPEHRASGSPSAFDS